MKQTRQATPGQKKAVAIPGKELEDDNNFWLLFFGESDSNHCHPSFQEGQHRGSNGTCAACLTKGQFLHSRVIWRKKRERERMIQRGRSEVEKGCRKGHEVGRFNFGNTRGRRHGWQKLISPDVLFWNFLKVWCKNFVFSFLQPNKLVLPKT